MLYKTSNPHGGDIYKDNIILDYSVNVNPFGTPDSVKQAIIDAVCKAELYPDPYCRELIDKISEYENILKEYVICGNGATELIYSYFNVVSPDKVVEIAPTFSEYSTALSKRNCKIIRYNLKKENDFELDEGILDFLELENPDVFVLCNPNNPTGRLAKSSLMEKILVLTKEKKIRFFVDECFIDFTENGLSMKTFLKAFPNLFILKAFTKSFGMASLRLGYALCSDFELLKKISENVQPWNVSGMAQSAGIAALSERELLNETVKYIANEKQWFSDRLKSLGFYVCPSDANFILFYAPSGLAASLKKYGILIRDCSNFYSLSDGWFRVCVRLHEENERLISAIKSVCERS